MPFPPVNSPHPLRARVRASGPPRRGVQRVWPDRLPRFFGPALQLRRRLLPGRFHLLPALLPWLAREKLSSASASMSNATANIPLYSPTTPRATVQVTDPAGQPVSHFRRLGPTRTSQVGRALRDPRRDDFQVLMCPAPGRSRANFEPDPRVSPSRRWRVVRVVTDAPERTLPWTGHRQTAGPSDVTPHGTVLCPDALRRFQCSRAADQPRGDASREAVFTSSGDVLVGGSRKRTATPASSGLRDDGHALSSPRTGEQAGSRPTGKADRRRWTTRGCWAPARPAPLRPEKPALLAPAIRKPTAGRWDGR